jgi:hypothetical protein
MKPDCTSNPAKKRAAPLAVLQNLYLLLLLPPLAADGEMGVSGNQFPVPKQVRSGIPPLHVWKDCILSDHMLKSSIISSTTVIIVKISELENTDL